LTPEQRIRSAAARLERGHAEQESGETGRRIYEQAVKDAHDVLTGRSSVVYNRADAFLGGES
jgi:hypothetical protein